MKRVVITGHPVVHSRSPLVHGYWLKQHGIEGEYGYRDVPPEEAADFYARFAEHGFAGCNVTIPHKETAFAALDEADEVARALGVANTLWLEDGKLCGANTDAPGFIDNLDASAPGWDVDTSTALVLGAGGASRAVIYGLLKRGFDKVVLANRTLARAEAVAAHFGPKVLPVGWDRVPGFLRDANVLVNTTSLGMKGQPPLDLDLSALRASAVVSDVVYVPLETPLLKAAKAQGLRTVDGLGMLLHQAVPGFERWFGVRPTVDAGLRALIVEDLRAKGQLEA
ncbi:shikimate dehydrogenase (NADP(+)) [Azorhizobium oxalatiphilum]|uniref:Shikimate dehydrogenase (NADP(+)) n=1 Tax=Azorhizobium oxalatiphilum TaxID=980631 RepID=A0A917C9W0_9HYPH|nr:shikimate dehydrogenase [Azorhizobium oxalatiphilum]GGF75730.1 shikimate dehydrogenase (NADP(+)) [Azorhizobium oxalatiphilum]